MRAKKEGRRRAGRAFADLPQHGQGVPTRVMAGNPQRPAPSVEGHPCPLKHPDRKKNKLMEVAHLGGRERPGIYCRYRRPEDERAGGAEEGYDALGGGSARA